MCESNYSDCIVCASVLEWFEALFCFLSLCCDFSGSNFFTGNEDISQLRKGDKFASNRHDGTSRHVDGKGSIACLFFFPKSVAVWLLPSIIPSCSI